MQKGYIALLDSGIGGINTLKEMLKVMPGERYLYLGDEKNAPYGNKTFEELKTITLNNLNIILRKDIKALVFACNTLSVTLLNTLKDKIPVPIYGVFPPIENANKKKENSILFCTAKTAERYKSSKYLKVIPLRNLAYDIENNADNLEKVDLKKHLQSSEEYKSCLEENFSPKTVILGCTHYSFIKNQFFDHLCPERIVSGDFFAAQKVKQDLKILCKLENDKCFTVDFIGGSANKNRKVFEKVVKHI